MRKLLLYCLLILSIFSLPALAQVGKITGIVKDASTGETLIGANIILEGTTIGAATDIEGYYVILNVPPGIYNLRVSMVGYTPQTFQDVKVNIGLTTEINANLQSTSFLTEEVVVVAIQPIVKQDVSSSVVNLNVEEIKTLPVVNVSSIIGLQAGVQGLTIRGGSSDQTAFVVNGITLRDERNNTPYTGISFTSIEELQIQTGGFNAEYGNIRSGLINVVTKEGKRDQYTFSMLGRYRPAGRKHFGDPINSVNSYWIRPYVDDDVAWTGTESGAWDIYTQRQYQGFRGWNKVSEELLGDDNPDNDLSPEAAQKLFLWQHRKQTDITQPDFDIDMSFSGPVPGGESLGGLRFAASYRRKQQMYLYPLATNGYRDYNGQIKFTSNIKEGMKLSIEGLLGRQTGTNSSRSGGPGLFTSPSSITEEIDVRSGASYLDARVYATDYWNPSTINTNMIGFKLSHVISPNTFYDVLGSRVGTYYDTNPGRQRDVNTLYYFGGIGFDESPFGVYSGPSSGIGSSMNMGLGFSNSRDSSKIAVYTLKFDYTSQMDRFNQAKAGFEFIYVDNNVNYALIEPSLPTNNAKSVWHTFPKRVSAYVQDKLEFEGMIANLGLRVDVSDPGGEWYVFDRFDPALSGKLAPGIDTILSKEKVEMQVNLSPRLGVAFPITTDSKLYFNYGHFFSMPTPEDLFLLRRSEAFFNVTRMANPSKELPRTIAYELGFEQNMFDQFLLSIKGYYKDVTNQTRLITYISRNGSVNYSLPEPNNFQDIRGFEIDIRKNRGDWITGFINYTYQVSTSGYFGLGTVYENPLDYRNESRNTRKLYESRPVPRPYGRANIDLFTPVGWGPELSGVHMFDQLRLSILGVWTSGNYFSWTGGGGVIGGYANNFQWNDFFNVDLRLSKTFDLGFIDLELFMDIINVFNIKYMSYRAGFMDLNDYDYYMRSLHLPADKVKDFGSYGNIPGDDNPGDIRADGVAFQPLEYASSLSAVTNPNTSAYYFDAASGKYFQWSGSNWSQVSDSRIDEVLKNKAYIDMPNLPYASFLNPRDVFFGFKINIDL